MLEAQQKMLVKTAQDVGDGTKVLWCSSSHGPFVGKMAWQLTWIQAVYGYDIMEITAAPAQAMNIG